MTPADLPCHGQPEHWFLPDHAKPGPKAVARAVAICNGCPERQQCLDVELDRMRAGAVTRGIFGGTTAAARRRILRADGTSPIAHNTDAGYRQHRARGETPCDDCKAAHTRDVTDCTARRKARKETLGDFMRRLRADAYRVSLALREGYEPNNQQPVNATEAAA